jgi:hypothetical protein
MTGPATSLGLVVMLALTAPPDPAPPGTAPAREPAPQTPAPPATSPDAPPPASTPSAPVRSPATRPQAPEQAAPTQCRVELLRWTSTRAAALPSDDAVRVALGRLVFSRMRVELVDAPAGKALMEIARQLDLNFAPRYDAGFQRDAPVNVLLQDVTAREAIEAIVSQASANATWQINGGVVEVGSREWLARQNARVTRIHELGELTLDHPYFNSLQMQSNLGMSSSTGASEPIRERMLPEKVAAMLMFKIANQIEPEAWLPPPPPDPVPDGKGGFRPPPRAAGGVPDAPANYEPRDGPIYVRGQWAQMDFRDQHRVLIVTAPDFVHRGISGYPPALPVAVGPQPASPASRP